MRCSALLISLFAALGLCFSCTAVSSLIHDDDVVAKVGESKLYKSEVSALIPNILSSEDSAAMAARYIDSWAKDRLYVGLAEAELSKEELAAVEEELEAYRYALVRYRYEQRYLNSRLDTLITDNQISEYYLSHQDDFKLSAPILKVRFVDVMKDSPRGDELLRLMTSSDYEDLQMADSLGKSVALRYFDNSDVWMDASELAQAFGVSYTEMLSRMKNKMIRIEPEGRGDLLAAYVCDMRSSGVAPIEYCKATIRDVLMNERKRELLKALEQDLLTEALESKQLVIYK